MCLRKLGTSGIERIGRGVFSASIAVYTSQPRNAFDGALPLYYSRDTKQLVVLLSKLGILRSFVSQNRPVAYVVVGMVEK